MSPARTFQNWGISSIEKRRIHSSAATVDALPRRAAGSYEFCPHASSH